MGPFPRQGPGAGDRDEVPGLPLPAEGLDGTGFQALRDLDCRVGVVQPEQGVHPVQRDVGGAEAGEVGARVRLPLGDLGSGGDPFVRRTYCGRGTAFSGARDRRHEVQHAERGQAVGARGLQFRPERDRAGRGVVGGGQVALLMHQSPCHSPRGGADGHRVAGQFGSGQRAVRAEHAGDAPGPVLTYLIRLTEPLPADEDLPPWWTDVSPNGEPDPQAFPGGHGNFGLSHGIGSALALLSLAQLRGLAVPGTTDALHRICRWTDAWRQQDATGPWWPGFLTLDQVRHQRVAPALRPRPSWCYGIAGTARAQQLAGLALGDADRQQTAETAMLTTLRAPGQLDRLTEIGLCHGTAGLLQSAWRMAPDARPPSLAAQLPHLTTRLIKQLDGPVTDPELLDGAAGAALALHTLGTGTAPATGWDTFLLLA